MSEISRDEVLKSLLADQATPPTGDPAPIQAMDATRIGRMARQGLTWIIGGGVIYLLAPSVLGVLAASDQLVTIDWYWLVGLVVAQAVVLYLTWVLQRLLLSDPEHKGARLPLALIASTQLVG